MFRRLRVRFAGGGLRRHGLSDFVNGLVPPRCVFHHRDVDCEWGIWHDPINLDGVERPDRPLLAVADGLAVERQIWPRYVTPFQVPYCQHERFVDPFEVPYHLY